MSNSETYESQSEVEARCRAYEDGILSGAIPASKQIRQAVERQRRDMVDGPARGLKFSPLHGWHAVTFFSHLRHSKGKWGKDGGQQFILSDWQVWATWVLFGWLRANGTRRFRKVYAEIARKNGKSTWAAGIGLYLFDSDMESGAEVYTAAVKRDQARIVHSEAVRMVKKSESLRKRIGIMKDNLRCESTESKFEPIGADADSTDGLNVHGAIIDEVHAHKSRAMWDVLETAIGAREQPLIFAITTAGSDDETLCGDLRKYTCGVLDGAFSAEATDSWFGLIYCIDPEDDWTDERVWIKANPNLGISVGLDDLREKANKAKDDPASRNAFLRLHLNRWTKQKTLAIPMEHWNACSDAVDPVAMQGRECWGGLDLSKISDLTSFVLVFPPKTPDEAWKTLPFFWTTEAAVKALVGSDAENYERWIEQGLIEVCDGDRIDFARVRAKIVALSKIYNLRDVGYDGWNAEETAQELKKEQIEMVEFLQSIRNFNEPVKTLLDWIKGGDLAHGGHAVLKWNASCLETKTDANNNMRPVKPDTRKSSARIDGIVALLMAIGRALVSRGSGPSVYETRGVLSL